MSQVVVKLLAASGVFKEGPLSAFESKTVFDLATEHFGPLEGIICLDQSAEPLDPFEPLEKVVRTDLEEFLITVLRPGPLVTTKTGRELEEEGVTEVFTNSGSKELRDLSAEYLTVYDGRGRIAFYFETRNHGHFYPPDLLRALAHRRFESLKCTFVSSQARELCLRFIEDFFGDNRDINMGLGYRRKLSDRCEWGRHDFSQFYGLMDKPILVWERRPKFAIFLIADLNIKSHPVYRQLGIEKFDDEQKFKEKLEEVEKRKLKIIGRSQDGKFLFVHQDAVHISP